MPDPMSFLDAVAGYAQHANANSSSRPVRLATIDASHDPNAGLLPKVTFDGESTLTTKRYPYLDTYTPTPGDRVAMIPVGVTYVIVGALADGSLAPRGQQDLYTASDTWDKPAGARWVYAEVQQAGHAGGGGPATTAGQYSAGAGGQAGGYAASWFVADDLDASYAVTVGAPGTGVSGATGNTAAASSFGSLVSASGGAAGATIAAATTHGAVSGGWAAQTLVGDIQIPGGGGHPGFRITTAGVSGNGGNSVLGHGGVGQAGAIGGRAGVGYGGGGGGASNGASGSAQSARPGGDGAPGLVVVTTLR